jgi:hypothetical protein
MTFLSPGFGDGGISEYSPDEPGTRLRWVLQERDAEP